MAKLGKRIERRVRKLFFRTLDLLRSPSGQAVSSVPVNPRILLIRTDRIGDAIVSTPALQLLHKHFPHGVVDILLGQKNYAVAPLLSNVHTTWLLPGTIRGVITTIRNLRKQRYDYTIDLIEKDSVSASMVVALCGAKESIGYRGEGGTLYSITLEKTAGETHIVQRILSLLAPLGIVETAEGKNGSAGLSVTIPGNAIASAQRIFSDSIGRETAQPLVALNVSATADARKWSADKYIELATSLSANGFHPVICGAPTDMQTINDIARAAGVDSFPVTSSLAEYVALLGHVHMVVTPDTSVVHIAAALRKPLVTLNTTSINSKEWGPWGVPYISVVGNGTIASITASNVYNAIVALASEVRISTNASTAQPMDRE